MKGLRGGAVVRSLNLAREYIGVVCFPCEGTPLPEQHLHPQQLSTVPTCSVITKP